MIWILNAIPGVALKLKIQVKAVDSEYMERLQSDTEKILAISQSMIQPNHPYQGFTHGNRGTLIVNPRRQNINMLAGLRKFYEEYYSANIMCLCVSKKLGMLLTSECDIITLNTPNA